MAWREYEYDDFKHHATFDDDEPVMSTNEQERYLSRKLPYLIRQNIGNSRYAFDFYDLSAGANRPSDLKYTDHYSKPPKDGNFSFRFKANPYQHDMIRDQYGTYYVLMYDRNLRRKYVYRKKFSYN